MQSRSGKCGLLGNIWFLLLRSWAVIFPADVCREYSRMCLNTCYLSIPPFESLGFLNYRRLIFSFHCLVSPSFNLNLPFILFSIFQPSQSRSSPSALSPSWLSNIFFTILPWSVLSSRCPTHSSPFFLMCAARLNLLFSSSLCSLFCHWSISLTECSSGTTKKLPILSQYYDWAQNCNNYRQQQNEQ